ncbi:hypothetical protein [Muriicola sp. Z0-33]|uniref:hypothetical protein n=1 Tax=Muriicola sp. Z0-33 TaxID=2816957 RepID=UPI0022389EB9|nr:hypothetical protein [Muriicola sp. Z0-33]MCW5518131.1 hypothetical protein [Muriicola sp. Z0-33]
MYHLFKSQFSKKSRVAKVAFYAITFLFVFPMLTSCSAYRINRLKNKSYKEWKAYQWNETKRSSDKDDSEWTIYSRKIKGTNLFEYKIEGAVASSPEACIAAFREDIYDHSEGHFSKKYPVYDILQESTDSLLTYVVHNEPFPFRDTEMKIQYVFIHDKDENKAVEWNEAWHGSSATGTKKLNRVKTFRGSWQFSTVSQNKSNAVNIVQFDPKGMPKWLVKPMVTKFLRNGLDDIRSATSK